jgi:4'-phosphopantetheinyl transferase
LLRFADAPDHVRDARGCLSPDERRRADRFHAAADRHRFALAHSFARLVLAEHLAVHPRDVPVARSPSGRPVLADTALAFSLSHCRDYAAVAVGPAPFIGVDAETVRDDVEPVDLARHCFADTEADVVAGVGGASARAVFAQLWACKEAFVKAIGLGLAYPLDRFTVSGVANGHPVLGDVEARYGPSSAWSLVLRTPEAGCHVAVASRTDPTDVTQC